MIKNSSNISIVLASACLAVLSSCSSGTTGSNASGIHGTVEGGEGQTLFLERFVNNKPVVTDSATVGQDGSFRMTPNPPLELNYYRLRTSSPENFLMLLTDSTESIQISTNASDLDDGIELSGSKNTELLVQLENNLAPHREKIFELRTALGTSESREELMQVKSEITTEMQEVKRKCVDFIKVNEGSPATLSALSDLSLKTDQGFYDKVLASTRDDFNHSYLYKVIAQQLANAKQQDMLAKTKSSSKNSKFLEGMKAPDIALNNPEGELMRLSDLKGKVVLIDFWASWCGPCRRENPHVVHNYEKYNEDGFEVFSVSLDKSVEPWKRAIDQDGLLWANHVSDLKGWQSDAASLYGIHSIPHTLLIDREGTIVGTHLRGQMLTNKLKEIFGH